MTWYLCHAMENEENLHVETKILPIEEAPAKMLIAKSFDPTHRDKYFLSIFIFKYKVSFIKNSYLPPLFLLFIVLAQFHLLKLTDLQCFLSFLL